ncbi:nucleotide sugar dehydrogenase [Candidatus Woesearchaeota archaeon]|nr:nucleotide sugar dehydrogenase [Candidatus Woesearchaeota archaeon]
MRSVSIIGLGYVGLPLAIICSKKGYKVYGIDVNEKIVGKTNKNISHIDDPYLKENIKDVRIDATTSFEPVSESDVILICVPTPVNKKHVPDLSYVESATKSISQYLKRGQIIILESTVSPGTVDGVMMSILNNGLDAMKNDYYLAHCPERIDPGNKKWTIDKIPRVVGGVTEEATLKAKEFYETIIEAKITPLKSAKEAEAAKIMENTFRDVNIAFVNEMAKSFDKAGIDVMEVIKGASTKPFAFMPHYPGVGVGGHCFDKATFVFLKNSGHQKVKQIGQYINSLDCNRQQVNDVEIFSPEDVKILSYDMIKKSTSFKPVKIASKRKTDQILCINCAYNYKLEVTDLHPVICYDNGLKVKFAKDIKRGDRLVLNKLLPSDKSMLKIDLINHLNNDLIKKIRVKPKNGAFINYKKGIDKNLKGNKRDYYKNNSLPLKKYLALENLLGIDRQEIYLCTGGGPSFKKIPAVLALDKDFLRLIGYYLSEGCLTTEKKTLRTRFTFNKNETEYINDLKSLLRKYELDYSVYLSTRFESYHIKVSSAIFGFLLRDILKCGVNCYNMEIPEQFFDLAKEYKEELLKGLFRGDGGVSGFSKKRRYIKNGKSYEHYCNSITVSYFTSSPVLFQQICLLLLNFDIVPKLSKRIGYMTLTGYKNVSKVKNWFLGEKEEKINTYLKNLRKVINYKKTKIFREFITISVENIKKIETDYVYSFEVADTNTLITSCGIIAHNCIAIDPYYLIDGAKTYGFDHQFLSLARKINSSMPQYTVDLFREELNKLGRPVRGAKVGILGLAYKGNVDDTRESPAFEVIDLLKKQGAELFVYEPYLPDKSDVKVLTELFEKVDYILLITNHNEFKNMDYQLLKQNNIKLVLDGRNCLDKESIEKLGILYKGIGR